MWVSGNGLMLGIDGSGHYIVGILSRNYCISSKVSKIFKYNFLCTCITSHDAETIGRRYGSSPYTA